MTRGREVAIVNVLEKLFVFSLELYPDLSIEELREKHSRGISEIHTLNSFNLQVLVLCLFRP